MAEDEGGRFMDINFCFIVRPRDYRQKQKESVEDEKEIKGWKRLLDLLSFKFHEVKSESRFRLFSRSLLVLLFLCKPTLCAGEHHDPS